MFRFPMFNTSCVALVACMFASSATAQSATDFRAAVKAVAPATVTVLVDQAPQEVMLRMRRGNRDPIWRHALPGTRGVYIPVPELGAASAWSPETDRGGFAVAKDLVISCNLPAEVDQVQMRSSEGDDLTGTVVVRDHVTGLVAIRVADADFAPIPLDVGNPESGLPVLISWLDTNGVATAEAAMIASEPNSGQNELGFVQALAGVADFVNTGAPIVNSDGTLVGVVFSSSDRTYCLPIAHVTRLIAEAGQSEPKDLKRGRIGVQLAPKSANVKSVVDESAAAEAGLEPGDVLVRVGDFVCETAFDVQAAVAMSRGGDSLELQVERGDETLEKTVQLSAPEPTDAPFTQLVVPSNQKHVFQFKDGKLLQVDPSDGSVHALDPRNQKLFQEFHSFVPELKVERSELEESLKDLEQMKREQGEMIDKLREQITRLESEAKAKILESKKIEVDRLEELVEKMKQRLTENDEER